MFVLFQTALFIISDSVIPKRYLDKMVPKLDDFHQCLLHQSRQRRKQCPDDPTTYPVHAKRQFQRAFERRNAVT